MQKRTRDIKIRNKLTVTRVEGGEGQHGKEEEGSNQGTSTKETRTMGWGLSLGVGLDRAGESNTGVGGMGTTVTEQQ